MTTTRIEHRPVPVWTWADRVRKARRDLGLTQAGFAELTGYTDKAIAAWESGRNTPDILTVSVVLSRATGIDRTWWIGLDDPTPPPTSLAERRERRDTRSDPTFPCLLGFRPTIRPWGAPRRRTDLPIVRHIYAA